MNKNDFIKLLNIIVEKKIKQIVPQLVKEEIDNFKKELLSESADVENDIEYNDLDMASILESNELVEQSRIETTPAKQKKYSSNDSINAILNQTAMDMKKGKTKPIQKDTNYKQLLEQSYNDMDSEWDSINLNTNNLNSIVNNRASRNISNSPRKDIARENLKNQVAQSGAPSEIANVMVKDYSKFLKDMDSAAKKNRPK